MLHYCQVTRPVVQSYPIGKYDYKKIREITAVVFDQSDISWSGQRVLVKPNQLGPFGPDSAAVTHPMLIRAVREELHSRGAKILVGDNPGMEGYGMLERIGHITGAKEAAKLDWTNLSLRPRKVPLSSRFADSVMICSEVLEVDRWISLPKFKTHMLTILTGALKNSYGLLVGAEKVRLHSLATTPEKFGELIVDVFSIRPPDLTIMDAIVAMEGFGPSGGDARNIGCILASENAPALDLVMCHTVNISPERVPTQRVAIKRGLAPERYEDVEVQGDIPVLKHFKLPSPLLRFAIPRGERLILRPIYKPSLKVLSDSCTCCGSCAKVCPANAIEIERHPSFDTEKCIACYCCFELCPENAIQLSKFVRLVRRVLS